MKLFIIMALALTLGIPAVAMDSGLNRTEKQKQEARKKEQEQKLEQERAARGAHMENLNINEYVYVPGVGMLNAQQWKEWDAERSAANKKRDQELAKKRVQALVRKKVQEDLAHLEALRPSEHNQIGFAIYTMQKNHLQGMIGE